MFRNHYFGICTAICFFFTTPASCEDRCLVSNTLYCIFNGCSCCDVTNRSHTAVTPLAAMSSLNPSSIPSSAAPPSAWPALSLQLRLLQLGQLHQPQLVMQRAVVRPPPVDGVRRLAAAQPLERLRHGSLPRLLPPLVQDPGRAVLLLKVECGRSHKCEHTNRAAQTYRLCGPPAALCSPAPRSNLPHTAPTHLLVLV